MTFRMFDSLTTSCGMSGSIDGTAAANAAGTPGATAGIEAGVAPSMSTLTMRPLGPEPLIVERSMALASARRRASGLALIRLAPIAGAADDATGTAAVA